MANEKEQQAEPAVTIVDRRRWAHGEAAEAGSPVLKPSYVVELEQQLAEKDKAIQAHAARYRESAGEFEQVRARLRRDLDKEIERARRAVLVDMLDVADNLDRAVAAARTAEASGASLSKGIELVRDQLLAKLAGYGARPMVTDGAAFDPALHDAVSIVPVTDPAADDRVVATVRTGYTIGSTDVLRPAAVVVGRITAG